MQDISDAIKHDQFQTDISGEVVLAPIKVSYFAHSIQSEILSRLRLRLWYTETGPYSSWIFMQVSVYH